MDHRQGALAELTPTETGVSASKLRVKLFADGADLEGIRRRLESLSPSEISGFLEELGEDLAELGG